MYGAEKRLRWQESILSQKPREETISRNEMSAMFDDAKSCGAAGLGSGSASRRLSLSTERKV